MISYTTYHLSRSDQSAILKAVLNEPKAWARLMAKQDTLQERKPQLRLVLGAWNGLVRCETV